MAPDQREYPTQARLLRQAEMLFAEKGYHAVSVREITNAAKCNLAAVNYHFGNKKNLYLNVFRSLWMPRAHRIHECFRNNLAACRDSSPPTVIRAVAEAFLQGPLSDEERLWHSQLMISEMTKPTEAFDLVATEIIQPFFEEIGHALHPSAPEDMDNEQVTLIVLSIISMIIYFTFARTPVSRLTGCTYDHAFTERLVNHIVRFCLSGLNRDASGRKDIS